MSGETSGARVGEKAPDFLVGTGVGEVSLAQLAARHQKLVLTSQDSYRYHPN